jgi:hypothetical protein
MAGGAEGWRLGFVPASVPAGVGAGAPAGFADAFASDALFAAASVLGFATGAALAGVAAAGLGADCLAVLLTFDAAFTGVTGAFFCALSAAVFTGAVFAGEDFAGLAGDVAVLTTAGFAAGIFGAAFGFAGAGVAARFAGVRRRFGAAADLPDTSLGSAGDATAGSATVNRIAARSTG